MITGLFFGTFDPIHMGHIQIAKNLIRHNIVKRVCFVITPISPFKKNKKISAPHHRIHMVNLAIKDYDFFSSSDIEFNLPSPQYTARTLRYIKTRYLNQDFFIIMGADNYQKISDWKDYKYILDNFKICVYQRTKNKKLLPKEYVSIPGDFIDLTSSQIRENIHSTPPESINKDVLTYALHHRLYS